MKLLILLNLLLASFSTLIAQQFHVRPLNIQDCNNFEAIFIGKIKEMTELEGITEITFFVEEGFKLKNNKCEIRVKSSQKVPQGFDTFYDESWLIFASQYDEEFYLHIGQSTGLNQFKTYFGESIQQDLTYLRNLTLYQKWPVKQIYQLSARGCIRNDEYYIAEGVLINGFPHGEWKYYCMDGIMQSEGYYYHGTKWGTWFDYHKNGYVFAKSILWNGLEIKRIQYDNWGELYCLNEDCLLGTRHPSITLSFLWPSEKCGFLREKVSVSI